MKQSSLLLAVTAALVLGTSACAKSIYTKPTPTETEAFIAQNEDLTDFDKECLANNEFKVGMQSKTLLFMLGEPKTKTEIRQAWAVQEIWFYKVGGKKQFTIEDGGVVGIEELE